MLFDDYVLRQVQKIAELAAAIAARASGQSHVELEAELAEAFRALLGMDRESADRLTPDGLARLLGEDRQIRALALLMQAQGDLCEARGQPAAAMRSWERALALLAAIDDEELRGALVERLARAS